MPYYEIVHSYPLEPKQRQELAHAITKLHAHTFTTPSIFVHVQFKSCDATDGSYYVAGNVRETATNRIFANVRTGSRTKKDFDELAAKIEDAWYEVINGEKITEGKDKGKRENEVDETERDRLAKELLFVVFHPMIAIRERGLVIPEAGHEKEFYDEYLPFIKKQVDEKGDEEWQGMLDELQTRDDLKEMLGGGSVFEGLMEKLGLGEKGKANGGEKGKKAGTNGEKKAEKEEKAGKE